MTSVLMNFRLPPQLYALLKQESADTHIPMSALIRISVEAYLKGTGTTLSRGNNAEQTNQA